MDFIKLLFSVKGLLIGGYILIGVFVNTAAPHLPIVPNSVESIHSWVQWFISVFFWPLSLWRPEFTTGKWT
jgi:hypothetical protein